MSQAEQLFTGLLAVALAGAGLAYYQAQARQAVTLGRITALENRLISSNEQRAEDAKNTVAGISTAVRRNHNQAADMAVLQQAKEIQSRTQILLDTLHQLHRCWQTADRAELRQLPAQLYYYIDFLQTFTPDARFLNHESADTEIIDWFDEFDTAREPKPAALALLTKLETRVRQIEVEALIHQAQRVGTWCGFDKLGAFAIPSSETVAPGAVYQARLMILPSASTSQAQFSINGRAIPTDHATSQATVHFTIPAARPGQPDTVRATWHGRVQLPWAAGDTVLETIVPYFIVKPAHR